MYCGKEFKMNLKGNQKYCSQKCCEGWYRHKKPKEVKYCAICGREVEDTKRLYCSPDCSYEAMLRRQSAYKSIYKKPKAEVKEEPKKKRGRKKKKLSLAEINELARAEGLNYGQYVAKYGL
jgi:hypothetical protein